MREQFQEELDGVSATLVQMAGLVKVAMEHATTALLTADLTLAEKVIADDSIIDDMQHELDARTIKLITLQGPVASDLRTLVTSLRMSADLERMGDLAHHISKSARMRYPATAVPPELALTIEDMGRVCVKIIEKVATVLQNRDAERALEVEKDDDEIDALHRKIIQTLLDPNWTHGVETAIDMTLLGRYYERCADHAVSIARRVYFLVTGTYADSDK
ncbi:MAG: PhoU family transcriptional regulator [Actinobacteria bacterium BACL4 MAG-120820-bin23]|jgi:phosphate transport system protein|uniref:phosphate signaling complex protein PhoU n=1 Tax=Candidatus Nanopelagicus sp. TaxID=2518620 RepID=UPI0007149E6C|nr:MAG: PhoU family transcriptional regulator [Actinobacteria bacterium BACL4 MAG-121022-bin9]KRO44436.1 MAG: PhoU family transcriptional regulator [Actinobacteria bacterium BACL4 MAG-120813-bin39]KRO49333.1 MAG: PhoU family transcriptional regulator [Actinobacteria bacterium BACL4 MAG-121001-bin59]KRO49841.1 MAG: PhoU family transcriptional regulator [Actinobacteria bacterium BACL4 MAG-120820-bin23]KRO76606.1 MAG: PhoU family transcriptional regulator [Actinobacteria bacterium BACL4 MAG-120920